MDPEVVGVEVEAALALVLAGLGQVLAAVVVELALALRVIVGGLVVDHFSDVSEL